jgi:hypothetical protein
MLKRALQGLKLGDLVQGRVEEVMLSDDVLINFGGNLLRVHNETKRPFREGDPVTLIVKAVDPIRFQLLPERGDQRRRGVIDISV